MCDGDDDQLSLLLAADYCVVRSSLPELAYLDSIFGGVPFISKAIDDAAQQEIDLAAGAEYIGTFQPVGVDVSLLAALVNKPVIQFVDGGKI